MKKAAETSGGNDSGRQVIAGLSESELILLWDKLILFTAKRYFGVDYEDLVIEAFTSVIEGRRHWDSSKSPFTNLCWIIRSVADNEIKKSKKHAQLDGATEPSPAKNHPLTPVQDYLYAEEYERQDGDRVFSGRLRSLLKQDNLSLRIADHLLENHSDKPRRIAEALNVERRNVYAARKRLMRALKALTEGWKDAL